MSLLPVFDPTTPKVSVLANGMETLDSANELVEKAESQTKEFQTQASDKASYMLQACDKVPGGKWMLSAKNASVVADGLSRTLVADLINDDGNFNSAQVAYNDGDEFENKNGSFVKLSPGATTSTFSNTVKKCTLANATGVRLVFMEEDSGPLPVSQYKPPVIVEPGAVASFLVNAYQSTGEKYFFALKYDIQAFQGPFRGWKDPPGTDPVTVTGPNPPNSDPVEIKSYVVVGSDLIKYGTTISFEVVSNVNTDDLVQIQVKQVIEQEPSR